jgi:putative Mg2+ transporter-C (MgtC) family protein
MEHLSEVHALARLAIGAGLGVGIGLERQWRQRMAGGLQTCALVAAGATLYTLIAPLINVNGDQTRIVANIVTGIGFLAGGVILKEGLNVRGLNTAATIWATAAVGALAGFGLFIEALWGAVAIAGLNLFLTPLVDFIDRRGRPHRQAFYEISVLCKEDAVPVVGSLVTDTVNATELQLASQRSEAGREANSVLRVFELQGYKRDESLVGELVGRMQKLPGVIETNWSIHATLN